MKTVNNAEKARQHAVSGVDGMWIARPVINRIPVIIPYTPAQILLLEKSGREREREKRAQGAEKGPETGNLIHSFQGIHRDVEKRVWKQEGVYFSASTEAFRTK